MSRLVAAGAIRIQSRRRSRRSGNFRARGLDLPTVARPRIRALGSTAQRFVNLPARANLIAVKSLRIWLLVLLAFALPLRGAMAAAKPCAAESGHVHVAGLPGDHHAHAGHRSPSASHAHAEHDHASGAAHDEDGKCSLCASCCSATAPVAVALAMAQAPPAAADFPESHAPRAEFFSGGQERPPRNI